MLVIAEVLTDVAAGKVVNNRILALKKLCLYKLPRVFPLVADVQGFQLCADDVG